MRRSSLVMLFALAIFLAGCSGITPGGDETPAQTLTPAAVPTDEPTPTPVPQLAPGLTGEGVTDAFALGDAHASVLENTSYTMHGNYTTVYSNGTMFNRGTVNARLAANDGRYYTVQNRSGALFGGGAFGRAIWSDGERVLVAETTNGNTSYQSPRGPDREPVPPSEALVLDPTNRERIYALFGSVETRVTGRTQNGTTLYRVVATDVTNSVAFERQWQNPRNVTFRALISSQGLVREYRLNYTATLDDSTVRVHRHARYTDIGNTTVERPPWYDEAIENVSTATPTPG